MKIISKIALILASTVGVIGPAQAAEHRGKRPLEVHEDATRLCVFFRLDGVVTADPTIGVEPWFALPRSHQAFVDNFAILVTAKAANLPIDVITTGARQCGFAAVDFIGLP